MTEPLYSHIQQLLPGTSIPREEMAHFFKTITIQKDTLLLNEGEICDTIYFVNKGCLYLFYHDNDMINFDYGENSDYAG